MHPAPQPPPQRPGVLVVDDEAGTRESLRMILSSQFDVRVASGGDEALEQLRRAPVHLVTLDLNMPGMGGRDLMRHIRSEFPSVEVIVITGSSSVDTAAEGVRFGISDYLEKPFDVTRVQTAAVRAFERQRARARLARFLERLGGLVGRDRESNWLLEDLQRSQGLRDQLDGLLDGSDASPTNTGIEPFLANLTEALESKDRFMAGHSRRVSKLAGLLAGQLGLSPIEQENTRIAALLHDLGKAGVPTDLLTRASALDARERSRVEEHPAIAEQLVMLLGFSPSVRQAIRHHHEWWDGTGYPDGLAGEEIPLPARIIGVVDALDAMSCDRAYRSALDGERILSELRRFAGIQFDPRVVDALLEVHALGRIDPDETEGCFSEALSSGLDEAVNA